MASTWGMPQATTDTLVDARADINNSFEALRTLHSGGTAPASTVAFMLWLDTSTSPDSLKMRNAADSGWVTLFDDVTSTGGGLLQTSGGTMSGALSMGTNKITNLADGTADGDACAKSQIDDRKLIAVARLGDIAATTNVIVWGGEIACTLQKVSIIVNAAITADNTNYWSIDIENKTAGGTPVILASPRETTVAGTGFSAYTTESLGAFASGEDVLAADEVLELQMTKNASATTLGDAILCIQYEVATT